MTRLGPDHSARISFVLGLVGLSAVFDRRAKERLFFLLLLLLLLLLLPLYLSFEFGGGTASTRENKIGAPERR